MYAKFPDHIREFIKNNVKGIGNKELTALVNKEFNTEYTVQQIKSFKDNNGLSSGLTGYFEKGHVPANKGWAMSSEAYERCRNTMFKKGQLHKNTAKLGTEVTERDGYIIVKCKMSDYPSCTQQKKSKVTGHCWIPKHQKVWFEHYGEIPKKHKIIFLDGNKQNFEISNLACVSNNIHARMNQNRRYSKDSEITKAGIALEKLKHTFRQKCKKDT